ncbi:hypothetical protein [Leisingera daeponensis]|uniref:hypothetical protein n=1 Tax=Leisingera daeponensis TaxID=405746 RepID=UPI001C97CEF9|nr:hypothetical protein [Leisingera daeponensis]MBY6059681.1 hypothetical protein [Leisingera daeponensis]
MRRLMTKFWKEISYLVGLFGLGFAQVSGFKVETFGVLYTGAGMAWFVIWLLQNNDPNRDIGAGINTDLLDSRNLHGSHYRQY